MSKLSKAERDALPSSAFVFPGDRRYPIHDRGHAQAALMDSRGTKDEGAVRAAVKARYPALISLATPAYLDIDLTRHVRTERGVAYFHLPIGSPIGGGGRSAKKVPAKTNGWNVNGQKFNDFGEAEQAALKLFSGTTGPKRVHLASAPSVQSKSGFVQGKEMSQLVDKNKAYKAKQRAARDVTTATALEKSPQADNTFERAILQGAPPLTPEQQTNLKDWWTSVKPEEKVQTQKALGLKYPGVSPRELRKRAKDPKTSPEERKAIAAEIALRARIAKQATEDSTTLSARLAKKLEGKPEGADIEPYIGETLSEHPSLGPLAHIWDRLRITKHKFGTGLPWTDVVKDKGGDVVKGVSSVLLAILLMHLGVFVPGLGTGG